MPVRYVVQTKRSTKKPDERKREIRTMVLRGDAEIAQCGCIETKKGCVMKSDQAVNLAETKVRLERKKRQIEMKMQVKRKMRDERRLAQQKASAVRFQVARMSRRVQLAGVPVKVLERICDLFGNDVSRQS